MNSGPDASQVQTRTLDVAVERWGDEAGWPVILLHGFPYDTRAYDHVAPLLAVRGAAVIVPYLRGYGPTRFRDEGTPRSGQQAALAHDLLEVIDALNLDRPIVAGYDWGGRAACVVATLWPARVSGLVTVNGYNLQNIPAAGRPQPPDSERPLWYQYYLHGDRGKSGLSLYRNEFARQLWQEWSPAWRFTDDEFAATAGSFANPDFVEVVVHSYRHRFGLVAGDPAHQGSEDRLAEQPAITVPTIVIEGSQDTVNPPRSRTEHEEHFTNLVDYRLVAAGHNVPQEVPRAFADAVLSLH